MRLAAAGALFSVLPASAREVHLSGTQIRAAISGRYVTDDRHWAHRYFADGRVERSENGRQRTARWFIEGHQLCLLRPEISTKDPICYSVVRDGRELLYQDDGQRVVFRGQVQSVLGHAP